MRHWLVGLMVVVLCGCTGFVTRQIERPGHDNRAQLAWFRQLLNQAGFRFDAMQTRQDVRMAYWYGEPRAYGFTARVSEQRKDHRFSLDLGFKFAVEPAKAVALPARGSVILLHPWGTEGSALANWALSFTSAGYVVVAPDLRSHGESSAAPVGYGPREADDIAELVRGLRVAGRLPGPLFLFGVSYGGTVALFTASKLTGVGSVVAMEPYANAAAVIRRAPVSGLFGYKWLASWLSPQRMDKAIARASRQLGVDLFHLDPGDALTRTATCTLILRGADDALVSDAALRALVRRSVRASYVEIPHEGHRSLPLRTDRLFPPLLEWIAALPSDHESDCPDFTPLPFVTTPSTKADTSP
jgi:pimeloyl-ACP methyl ester carboxylesterase